MGRLAIDGRRGVTVTPRHLIKRPCHSLAFSPSVSSGSAFELFIHEPCFEHFRSTRETIRYMGRGIREPRLFAEVTVKRRTRWLHAVTYSAAALLVVITISCTIFVFFRVLVVSLLGSFSDRLTSVVCTRWSSRDVVYEDSCHVDAVIDVDSSCLLRVVCGSQSIRV